MDRLLANERIRSLAQRPAPFLAELARSTLEMARGAISEGRPAPSEEQLAESVLGLVQVLLRPSLRPVINATGVIIHTNLGRAPLSREAVEASVAALKGYSNLEFDLESGERGSRYSHLESILRQVTGAEAGIAVNNNAAALLLVLSALTKGREVIISRGQLVEIGGGFRIPDVMQESGARLVEVGTTNRTRLGDYESAVTAETAALLRVHASNFRIVGFAESPPLIGLAQLAQERRLLMLDDIGSGCLLDTTQFGLAAEPAVQESLAAGADLVMFSGDKLLGGPQAGIIVGRKDLVDVLRRHPLARALRMDKGSVAGLAATLLHYLEGRALEEIPVWQMIAMPLEALRRRANSWASSIGTRAHVVQGRSMIGGGSLPEESLPTLLLAIPGEGGFLTDLARRLRLGEPAIAGRIERDMLLFDPRTVQPEEDGRFLQALRATLQ